MKFYCNALVLNIFTGNTRAGITPGLSNNELELEQVSIGRDQEKYRHQGNNDLIHIYEGLKKLFFKLTTLRSNCLLTAPNADIEPYSKETMQSQVGNYLSTRGKLN